MLASSMRLDFDAKFEMGKNIFDKALLYINPEIWLKEKETLGELPADKYRKVNSEFKQIQAHGRATGEMPENTMIAKALKQAFAMRGTIDPKDRLVLRGELDNLQEFSGATLPAILSTDPDELG